MVYEKTHVAAATHVQAELPETGGPFDTADKQEITKQTPLKRSANHAFADPIDEERQSITLRSPHTAPGLDTSTIASSKRSRSRTPLAEKVIQADIRIDSIEDSGPDPAATQLILTKNTSPDAEDVNDKKRMKMWWNASSAQSLNLPEYYAQVAVLLIKWSNELDELYTRNEVQEASELFRDRYGYRAEIVELDVRSKPQHQLNRRILSFIAENDGPNNLLIVYYVGCGVFRDLEHYLELRAFVNPARARGFEKDARANWNRVEDILRSEDVESDVLTILDVGFTSNIGQDLPALPYTASSSAISESRCFELITSIQIDQSGAPIGEGIFTRSLIDTLRSCLDEKPGQPISTFRLAQQINLDKRRVEAPVQIWSRGLQSKHILLQPLKPGLLQRYEMFRGRTGGRLTLELELRDEQLNEAQIEYLANNIGKALRDKAILGLRKINWLGMEPVQQSHADRVALVMFAFVKWKEVVRQRRERRRAEELSVSE
ncbi:hypothetical protein DE146DRAFT_617915 [Phaeosphaeria sp. MPI-PUGE-AT-0046c]|nr:hypothetical protein DE146DRAFT_617915 [Phaeosphaeria sp. MPI-PUGE-AT-0046c]